MKYIRFIWKIIYDYCLNLIVNIWLKTDGYFNKNHFSGFFYQKKVVLIGPAEDYNLELENALELCNVIALVNKGYRTSIFDKLKSFNKQIVLFHCLDESETSGGGSLIIENLKAKGISDIFYPLNEGKIANNVLNFISKYKIHFNLYWIHQSKYKILKKGISGFLPNTGFAALFGIHQSNCDWVYVHGLTFHRTAYISGYGSDLEDLQKNIKFIESAGNHNPDMDWKFFLKLYNQGRIKVSPLLNKLMDLPYQQLFYIKT